MNVLRSDATSVAVVLAIVSVDRDICLPDRMMANKDDLSPSFHKFGAVSFCLFNDCEA